MSSEEWGKVAIVTVSDSAYNKVRVDRSGPVLVSAVINYGYDVVRQMIVADEKSMLESALIELCEQDIPLLLTTGGTGLSQRDVTPEATTAVMDRPVPGMAEQMRRQGMAHTPLALLSRAVAGIRNRTLIVNLPGSPKGAVESFESLVDILPHALKVLREPFFHHDGDKKQDDTAL